MNNKDKNISVQIIISIIGLLGTIIAAVIGSIGFSPEIRLLVSSPTPFHSDFPTYIIYPTFTPTSTAIAITPSPQTGLETIPIKFSVLVTPEKFLQNDPSAIQNFSDQVEQIFKQFKNPHVGLILTTAHGETSDEGLKIAEMANRILAKSSPDIFSKSVMKSFSSSVDNNNPSGTIEFEIYLFSSQVP